MSFYKVKKHAYHVFFTWKFLIPDENLGIPMSKKYTIFSPKKILNTILALILDIFFRYVLKDAYITDWVWSFNQTELEIYISLPYNDSFIIHAHHFNYVNIYATNSWKMKPKLKLPHWRRVVVKRTSTRFRDSLPMTRRHFFEIF